MTTSKLASVLFASVVLIWSITASTLVLLEEEIVDYIILNAENNLDSQSDLNRVKSLSEAIARFSEPRREFADSNGVRLPSRLLRWSPILSSLAYGGGACGYATEIGVRVMEKEGFEARFMQVLNANGRTVHVAMDVVLDSYESVVVDPIYGHLFLDLDGRPMSSKMLQKKWDEVVVHLPQGKIRTYSYEHGVQYTNWGRSGAVKGLQGLLKLAHVDTYPISLRVHFNAFRRKLPFITGLISLLVLMTRAWKNSTRASLMLK